MFPKCLVTEINTVKHWKFCLLRFLIKHDGRSSPTFSNVYKKISFNRFIKSCLIINRPADVRQLWPTSDNSGRYYLVVAAVAYAVS